MGPQLSFQKYRPMQANIKEMASDANLPINDQDILNTIYNFFFNTGIFYNYCVKCKGKAQNPKTWTNFQVHFIKPLYISRRFQKDTSK